MQDIENKIVSVINRLNPYISESDAIEILNLVTLHGEYGLGMENLCAILEEKKIPITSHIRDEILQIFRQMEFGDDVLSYYEKHLKIKSSY